MAAVLLRFALALVLTVAAEGLIALVWQRRLRVVYASVLCNLLTNPALNLALLLLAAPAPGRDWIYYLGLAVGEIAAVFIEAAVYQSLCRWKFTFALLFSAVLNAASFGLGFLVRV